ncbi:acyl carrier protein [Fulvivirga sp. 29W222]|uniref:Acyl carrier protein n=1 Tax=Fulvivirga marina TaxID=2494733 RepID=A0A937KGA9_9BACT|nr:acyl carrier protein [Fulvivirga marina]MBL6449210.1 acyl carrier protein [Fulvivirga marina]
MVKPKSQGEIIVFLQKVIAEETKLPYSDVDENLGLHQFGLDSISSVYLLEKVENYYGITISPLYFWDYPTIRLLATQIFKENFQQQ